MTVVLSAHRYRRIRVAGRRSHGRRVRGHWGDDPFRVRGCHRGQRFHSNGRHLPKTSNLKRSYNLLVIVVQNAAIDCQSPAGHRRRRLEYNRAVQTYNVTPRGLYIPCRPCKIKAIRYGQRASRRVVGPDRRLKRVLGQGIRRNPHHTWWEGALDRRFPGRQIKHLVVFHLGNRVGARW